MKIVSVVLLALASLTLLGCPEENKAGGGKPAASGASKTASSAAPAGSGGW